MTHYFRKDLLLLIAMTAVLMFAGAFSSVTSAAQGVPASKTTHNSYSSPPPGAQS